MRTRRRRQFFFYVQHRGNAVLLWVLALCVFVAMSLLVMDLKLRPQIREWAESRARYLATRVINEAISEELDENAEEYANIVRFEKDESGQILAVQTDIVKINNMKSRIVNRISQKLREETAIIIRIPLGNALGTDVLYGRGPAVPVHLIPLGSANANFVSVFTNAGINQTRHQILIEASVELSVLAPGSESSVNVSSQISIAETVLIGDVPNSYTYIDGQSADGLGKYYQFKNADGEAEVEIPVEITPPEEMQRKQP